DPRAGRLHVGLERVDLLPGVLHLLVGHRLAGLAVGGESGKQVARHRVLLVLAGEPSLSPHYERRPGDMDMPTSAGDLLRLGRVERAPSETPGTSAASGSR